MLTYVLGSLWQARVRALSLVIGVLVVSVSFSLLTAATTTTRGEVREEVINASRPAYDILVRPPGAATALEQANDVVPANFQSGIFGGITVQQWQVILGLSGVEAAAPVANLGYVLPATDVTVPLSTLVDPALDEQLLRTQVTWTAQAGTTTYPGESPFVYITKLPDGCTDKIVLPPALVAPFESQGPQSSYLSCFQYQPSPRDGSPCYLLTPNFSDSIICDPQVKIRVSFPMLLSAIDPVEEDKLVGLSDAMVDGRPLRRGERVGTSKNIDGLIVGAIAPVLVSARSYTDVSLDVAISRVAPPLDGSFAEILNQPTSPNAPPPPVPNAAYQAVRQLPATPVQTVTFDATQLYDATLAEGGGGLFMTSYWSTSEITYTQNTDGSLRPNAVNQNSEVFRDNLGEGRFAPAPLENQDANYRQLTPHASVLNSLADGGSMLDVVGKFDPALLPGFDPLTALPLETYNPPVATPADEASRTALGGEDYRPTRNLGGYLAQPPFLLTTIDSLPEFLPFFQDSEQDAPISVIRVKVDGSTGTDEQSLRRIEAVAALIQERTGLQVDVTAGSSPVSQLISIPASVAGTPALLLRENWVQKGVALRILAAVDRKSVLLLGLILLVSTAFLLNAGVASVRSRRSEIGLLLSTGWRRRSIFAAILGELVSIGILAGVAGTGLAFALAGVLDLRQPAWRLALVAPTAVLLTALAGLIPAVMATRGQPMDALTPPVRTPRRGSRVNSVSSMAISNIRRNLGRTLISVSCIFVATAALAVLITISLAFQGNVVGTLLGDVIAIKVRAADYISVGLVLALAALALADVMILTTRERAVELVTLRATGWADSTLVRLIATEGVAIGVLGSLFGAGAGILAGTVLGAAAQPTLIAASVSALVGLTITVIAATGPAVVVARLPIGVASAEA